MSNGSSDQWYFFRGVGDVSKFLTHQGKVLVPIAWEVGVGLHGFFVDLESTHTVLSHIILCIKGESSEGIMSTFQLGSMS